MIGTTPGTHRLPGGTANLIPMGRNPQEHPSWTYVDMDGDSSSEIAVSTYDFNTAAGLQNAGIVRLLDFSLSPSASTADDIIAFAIEGPSFEVGLRLVSHGDVDNDGRQDLLLGVGSNSEPSSLQLIKGSATLAASTAVTVASSAWSVAEIGIGIDAVLADVDGDGLLDLIAPGATPVGSDQYGGISNGGFHIILNRFLVRP